MISNFSKKPNILIGFLYHRVPLSNTSILSPLTIKQLYSIFEILLVKKFSLKQETKSNTFSTIKKIKFLLFNKTVYGSFRLGIRMGKCKTKAIQTYWGSFRHNQAYPGIIQAYSKPYVTLEYSEPWYIQKHDIFRTRSIFKTLQVWYIQNPDIFRTLTYSPFEA